MCDIKKKNNFNTKLNMANFLREQMYNYKVDSTVKYCHESTKKVLKSQKFTGE